MPDQGGDALRGRPGGGGLPPFVHDLPLPPGRIGDEGLGDLGPLLPVEDRVPAEARGHPGRLVEGEGAPLDDVGRGVGEGGGEGRGRIEGLPRPGLVDAVDEERDQGPGLVRRDVHEVPDELQRVGAAVDEGVLHDEGELVEEERVLPLAEREDRGPSDRGRLVPEEVRENRPRLRPADVLQGVAELHPHDGVLCPGESDEERRVHAPPAGHLEESEGVGHEIPVLVLVAVVQDPGDHLRDAGRGPLVLAGPGEKSLERVHHDELPPAEAGIPLLAEDRGHLLDDGEERVPDAHVLRRDLPQKHGRVLGVEVLRVGDPGDEDRDRGRRVPGLGRRGGLPVPSAGPRRERVAAVSSKFSASSPSMRAKAAARAAIVSGEARAASTSAWAKKGARSRTAAAQERCARVPPPSRK